MAKKELTAEMVANGIQTQIDINQMKIDAYKQGLEILENSIGARGGIQFTHDTAELTKGFIKDLESNQEWLKALKKFFV
jgi:hypothetical protein